MSRPVIASAAATVAAAEAAIRDAGLEVVRARNAADARAAVAWLDECWDELVTIVSDRHRTWATTAWAEQASPSRERWEEYHRIGAQANARRSMASVEDAPDTCLCLVGGGCTFDYSAAHAWRWPLDALREALRPSPPMHVRTYEAMLRQFISERAEVFRTAHV